METLIFIIFGIAAIAGALTMVWARNPVHSALGLMLSMLSVAVFYVLNSGHFIAAVQVIVYAGAVIPLFLFVVMLIGVDQADDRTETLPFQRQGAVIVAVLLAGALLLAGGAAWVTGPQGFADPNGTIEAISDELFDRWVLPFEVMGLLFIVAAAGTIALAKFDPKERELAAVEDEPEEVE